MSQVDESGIGLDLKKTSGFDYDDWLEFFRKKVPAGKLIDSQEELKAALPPDGYAALMRWLEIFENPSKMDKLYKGRLDKQQEEDIMDIAVGDDDEAFYMALIKQNTAQLNSSNVSQQEVARLTSNINIFRKELREIRSRRPKAGSTLEKVLAAASAKKEPTKTTKKAKTTSVNRKPTSSKAAGATKSKKTGRKSSGGGKNAKKT